MLTRDSSFSAAVIPKEHWGYPDSINQTRAAEERQKMVDEDVICRSLRRRRLGEESLSYHPAGFRWRFRVVQAYVPLQLGLLCELPAHGG